ncbi:Uridine diphosphate glucose pyrophosphatase [Helicobacter heilmannii]|uniref:NUDIX hydrolase n=1 Tax=Helicobacter heilmannii TaxID=35817 RepID=UPI0006A0E2DC|nr:NUDIX hydrolase [Helicobacter heilmannii]CRF46115.1 Uridine diphosphate glucose pyrophosphatase [Helicobacter heilmannii]CRF47747.1 Uridine diphosphate glucose pyrophosphatase [Helicobacter heilmannii]CRF50838.1 Uridine diphosphate glucose pyrophosphatase [Helicobacter heilmannii]
MIAYDNIQITDCPTSAYFKPKRILYEEDGINKSWDMVRVHDSVSILLYHIEKQSFVLVKQFRPPVFVSACIYGGQSVDGYTYELCAGLVDKAHKSVAQIACEEVLEECGYAIVPEMLQKIGVFYSSTGISGSKQTMFFARISQNQHAHQGGGIDTEDIEIIYLPLDQVESFMSNDQLCKSVGVGYGLVWFQQHFKDGHA